MSRRGSAPLSLRRLLGAVGVGLLLLLAAGAALTWRIVVQERVVALEQSRQRLEALADLVAVTLRSAISELDQALAVLAAEGSWTAASASALGSPGVVAYLETPVAVDAHPAGAVVYLPWLAESAEELVEPFRQADRAELVSHDLDLATQRLMALMASSDARVRAGALIRLARVQRKQGLTGTAAETYARLESLDGAVVAGVPVALIALHGRCALLAAESDRGGLRRCASTLGDRLLSGRWPLSAGVFGFYRAEAKRWLAGAGSDAATSAAEQWKLAVSAAMSVAWKRAHGGSAAEGRPGGESVGIGGWRFLLLWRRGKAAVAGAVASAGFFHERLAVDVIPALRRRGAALSLVEPDGSQLLEIGAADPGIRVVRTAVESRVPWNLALSSAVESASELAPNRWLIPGAYVAAVLVILAAAYAAFRATGRELSAARLQSDFVAAVSHEFRSPLASLRQMSEMLNEGRVRDEARRRQYLRTMEHETKRLQRLVDGLLDFGRMEAGVQEFRLEVVDAADLVHGVIEEFRAEPIAEGREIRADLSGDPLPVMADREALARAIWNLLDNAAKYAPGGGAITARAAREEASAVLSVADHGIGIDQGDQRRIFDSFVRGRGAASVSVQGTGLGLAMVRRIVAAHRGQVSLESAPGEGSTFTIVLPLAEEAS